MITNRFEELLSSGLSIFGILVWIQRDKKIEMTRIMSISNASSLFHICCSAFLYIIMVPRFIMLKSRYLYIAIIAVAFVVSCAPLQTLPPAKPISQDRAHQLINQMSERADEVASFVGLGKLIFKEEQKGTTSVNLLAVGRRPSKVRIELDHAWGKPLIYLVADRQNTSVLSFVENIFYSGASDSLKIRQLFPFELDLEIVWVILSGRVPILPHSTVESLKPNEITLFDEWGKKVERIIFAQDPFLPTLIHLHREGLIVELSQFKKCEAGFYPSKVSISQGDDRQVEIRYTSLEFNRPIPEEVFSLNPPPDVRIIRENDQGR
jgi:outer membrane biogenesis lipoprotein LolB